MLHRENYVLNINNYNGPLDLLVDLIREKRMDIFAIDLSELATAYVKLIANLQYEDIDLASEYLVMAASLLQLKARILLENPADKVEVEKEKKDLLARLTEYYKYKVVTQELREREQSRSLIFIKASHDYTPYLIESDPARLDGHSDVLSLVLAMRKMIERTNLMMRNTATIESFNLSPSERRLEIVAMINAGGLVSFESIFKVPTLNHFVVTFITILDMARNGELVFEQEQQYGPIVIRQGVPSHE